MRVSEIIPQHPALQSFWALLCVSEHGASVANVFGTFTHPDPGSSSKEGKQFGGVCQPAPAADDGLLCSFFFFENS